MKMKLSPTEKREIFNLLFLFIFFLTLFINLKTFIFKKTETPLTPSLQEIIKINPEFLKTPLFESLTEIQKVERPSTTGKENPFK